MHIGKHAGRKTLSDTHYLCLCKIFMNLKIPWIQDTILATVADPEGFPRFPLKPPGTYISSCMLESASHSLLNLWKSPTPHVIRLDSSFSSKVHMYITAKTACILVSIFSLIKSPAVDLDQKILVETSTALSVFLLFQPAEFLRQCLLTIKFEVILI